MRHPGNDLWQGLYGPAREEALQQDFDEAYPPDWGAGREDDDRFDSERARGPGEGKENTPGVA